MISVKGQIHSSKNSRRIAMRGGKPILLKSEQATADEYGIGMQLNVQRDEWERMIDGCEYPLYVVFHFIRQTKARWDFLNLAQGVADAMVEAGYLPDDDVEHFIPVWGGYTVDKNDPGVDIWIQGKKE